MSRVAHGRGEPAVQLPDTVWNRILLPLERRGPLVLYALTLIYAAAYIVLLAAGESRDDLLLGAQIGRELVTLVFLGVLVAGYLSVRPTFRDDHPT